MILIGVIIGLIFDIYRVLKRKLCFSVYLINLFDFLIFIILTIIVFIRLVQINNGQVRAYMVVGVVVGSIVYYLSISNIMIEKIIMLIDFGVEVASKIKQLLTKLLSLRK